MNGKRYYPIVEIFWVGMLLLLWIGIWTGVIPIFIFSNTPNYPLEIIYNIGLAVIFSISSIAVIYRITAKILLGGKVFHIRFHIESLVIGILSVFCIFYSIYSMHFNTGLDNSEARCICHVWFLAFFQSVLIFGYVSDIREKGLIIRSGTYRWAKIQQIDIQKKQCTIKLTNGELRTYRIKLLKNNRDEILDLLREKTSVNLIDEGQESAVPSAAG